MCVCASDSADARIDRWINVITNDMRIHIVH